MLKIVTFAEDTNLLCSGEDMKKLLKTVENELIRLKKWFDMNKLSLNESKTKFMVFGVVPSDCEIKLSLNGVEI